MQKAYWPACPSYNPLSHFAWAGSLSVQLSLCMCSKGVHASSLGKVHKQNNRGIKGKRGRLLFLFRLSLQFLPNSSIGGACYACYLVYDLIVRKCFLTCCQFFMLFMLTCATLFKKYMYIQCNINSKLQ